VQKAECLLDCRLHIVKNYEHWIFTNIRLVVNHKVLGIIKTKTLMPNFDPSMKTLMRIVKFMTENSSVGKTQMVLDTQLNYARHLVWMEKKDLLNLQLTMATSTLL